MNDLDFLSVIESFRQALLFLFNSSLFWGFTALFLIVNSLRAFIDELEHPYFDVSRETNKPLKSWCYDENEI